MIKRSGSQTGSEGCLSIPGLFGDVERANIAVVEGINENGEKVKITGQGFLARIFQHEMDHLDGKLFIDKADSTTLHWVMPGQDEEE
jgi:peptide deformylase